MKLKRWELEDVSNFLSFYIGFLVSIGLASISVFVTFALMTLLHEGLNADFTLFNVEAVLIALYAVLLFLTYRVVGRYKYLTLGAGLFALLAVITYVALRISGL